MATRGGKMSLHCLQPSCFPSLQYSYKQAGENQSFVLSVFRRPLVKAGRSMIQISCFSIAVFLNYYRVALCTRYLDVVLQGSKSQAIPARSASNCQLSRVSLVIFVKYFEDMVCEVFEVFTE